MKTMRFLFILAGFGALTLGLGFAGEPPPQPASGPGPSADQVAKSHPAPGQPRADTTRTKGASAGVLRQPGLNPPVAAAKDRVMMSKTDKQRNQPALSPPTRQLSALPVHPAPGRSPAPASLGGLAPASAKSSAAAISGTGMKPKP